MSDPREIIRQAMQTHIDGTMRVVDRKWHAFCDCGADLGDTTGVFDSTVSTYDAAGRLHQAHLEEVIHDALKAAGLLVVGGVIRQVFRCYDLVSGGSYQTESREELEDFCARNEVHRLDPMLPPPHPKEHQTATVTTWPDGSVHTGPWQPAEAINGEQT